MVERLDADVGTVLGAAERRPDAANTMIIFTSDHGEMAGEKGFVTKGFPYDEKLYVGYADKHHHTAELAIIPLLSLRGERNVSKRPHHMATTRILRS